MRVNLTYLELHNPLFLSGNLGAKIDPKNKGGIKMEYDFELVSAIVQYGGRIALIPSSNIASMTLDPAVAADVLGIKSSTVTPKLAPEEKPFKSHPSVADISNKAQVSNPTTDVQNKR